MHVEQHATCVVWLQVEKVKAAVDKAKSMRSDLFLEGEAALFLPRHSPALPCPTLACPALLCTALSWFYPLLPSAMMHTWSLTAGLSLL